MVFYFAQQFYQFSKETLKWMQGVMSLEIFVIVLFKRVKIWK